MKYWLILGLVTLTVAAIQFKDTSKEHKEHKEMLLKSKQCEEKCYPHAMYFYHRSIDRCLCDTTVEIRR